MNTLAALLLASASVLCVQGASLPSMAVSLQSSSVSLNAPYNAFLSKYVSLNDGATVVDYGSVTAADRAALTAYISSLEGLRPSTMSRNDQMAFWFNLYNAKTIEVVLNNYPVTTIRSVAGRLYPDGPWKSEILTVEGQSLSLEAIEDDILWAGFGDSRMRYALNCAAKGCPNLKTTAWVGSTLNADLDAAARTFIAHPRAISIDAKGRVTASQIYRWNKKEFGGKDAAILDHIRQYATGSKLESLKSAKRINKYDYDWSLNDAR